MLTYPSSLPNPSRPFKYEHLSNALKINFESGHEQRRRKGPMLLTVEFTYNVLTQAEADVLTAFFIQCYGSVEPFSWTDPVAKKTYKMRFDLEQLHKEYNRHSVKGPLYTMTVKLRQVL